MIEISNLYKSYGKTKVLENINLKFEDNKIYGLLGRNGVGKTTLLNIISNQIKSNSGEVKLDGKEIFENSKAVSDICLVSEKGIIVDDIRVKKIFGIASILYKNWDEDYKDKLIEEFNLDIKKKYDKLSRGNKTIVGLIIGLASRSRITIFDEPSLGLDAAHRDKFYSLLLQDVDKNPRTIIISTHLIDEVTNLFEEVIILKDKKVFIKDKVNDLMKSAYYLNGKEEAILSIIDNKKVIHRESFGSTVVMGIFDKLTKGEKLQLKENKVEINPIPLQKLFIYLTENPYKREAV